VTTTLSIAVLILAVACLGLTITLIHLRRRHRTCRRTLIRVRAERDALKNKGAVYAG